MWESIGSTSTGKDKSFPNLEKGLEVVGIYLGIEEKPSIKYAGTFMKTHMFETKDKIVGIKSFAQIDKRLKDVESDSLVKVEYMGKSPEGWHRVNVFVGNDEEMKKEIRG